MNWFHVFVGLPRHRKSKHLQRILKQERPAWTYLVELWDWLAGQDHDGFFAPDSRHGCITRDSLKSHDCVAEIAEASGWLKDPVFFVEALIDSGWMDLEDGGLQFHEWDVVNLKYLNSKAKSAARSKRYRERLKAGTKKKRVTRSVTRDAPVSHGLEENSLGGGKDSKAAALSNALPEHAQSAQAPPVSVPSDDPVFSPPPPPFEPTPKSANVFEFKGSKPVVRVAKKTRSRRRADSNPLAAGEEEGEKAFLSGDWKALEPEAPISLEFFLGFWNAARDVPELAPAEMGAFWVRVETAGCANRKILGAAHTYLTQQEGAVKAPGRPLAVFILDSVWRQRIGSEPAKEAKEANAKCSETDCSSTDTANFGGVIRCYRHAPSMPEGVHATH